MTEYCTFLKPFDVFFSTKLTCSYARTSIRLESVYFFPYLRTRFTIITYAHNQPYISHTCSQANFHASATLGLGETYFIQNGLELGTASGVSYVSVI